MEHQLKRLTDYLIGLGIEGVAHTQQSYLAHLVGLYRDLESRGCAADVCCAGMFHSIYGTEIFQGFKLPLDCRPQIRELIGERAEFLAYVNCAVDRGSFDRAVQLGKPPYEVVDRLTGETIRLT